MKAKQSKWSFIYDIEVKDKRNYTRENLKRVKERLKLVSSRIIQKKYTSPNGSIMYECKIYLNKKKYLK